MFLTFCNENDSKCHFPRIDQKRLGTRKECLQTTGTKLLPLSSEDNSKVSQASYAKIASSNLPNNTMSLLQREYPQVSGSTFQFSKLVEEISSRIESLPYLQNFPFVTYAVPKSEYEKNCEDTSACGRNSDESFRKAPSKERRIELGLHGQTESLRKHDGGITSEQRESFQNQNLLHSSGKCEELSDCGRNSDESLRKVPSNERGIELEFYGQIESLRKHDGGLTSGQIESFENQNLLHSSGKCEDLSACGRNSDESFRKAPSNERGMELEFYGQIESLRKHDGGLTSGQIESFENQNLLHSSRKNEESYIANEHLLNDQRMEEIASGILSVIHTNSVHFPNDQNPHFPRNPQLQDIFLKSRQLCPEVHRNIKKDFAIRIFAHIAFLNDMFYRPPPFYSNVDVDMVVEYAWKGIKDYVLKNKKFQRIDSVKFQQILLDCSLFNKESFDLFRFLKHCAKICQIGVLAIKCEVEHTQKDVTTFLRCKIKEAENALHSCFECNVENNAAEIVKSFKL